MSSAWADEQDQFAIKPSISAIFIQICSAHTFCSSSIIKKSLFRRIPFICLQENRGRGTGPKSLKFVFQRDQPKTLTLSHRLWTILPTIMSLASTKYVSDRFLIGADFQSRIQDIWFTLLFHSPTIDSFSQSSHLEPLSMLQWWKSGDYN